MAAIVTLLTGRDESVGAAAARARDQFDRHLDRCKHAADTVPSTTSSGPRYFRAGAAEQAAVVDTVFEQ